MENSKIVLDPPYLDDEEKEIIEAFKRGEFKPLKNQAKAKEEHEKTAQNTLKKKPINVRLYERDLGKIKQLAQKDGIPYQTLISSIIHRFAEGTLKRAD